MEVSLNYFYTANIFIRYLLWNEKKIIILKISILSKDTLISSLGNTNLDLVFS